MAEQKLFFFDIDGTLCNDNKEILPSTVAAIAQLKAAGHTVAIATGRNLALAHPIIDTLQLDSYVLMNGALGYYRNELLVDEPLDVDEVARIVACAKETGTQVVYQQNDQMVRQNEQWRDDDFQSLHEVGDAPVGFSPDDYLHRAPYQILIFADAQAIAPFEQLGLSHIRFVRWHERAVDGVRAHGSKATSIVQLAERAGVAIDDVIAFGDGNNDIEMMQSVGFSVAMGNAVPAVKAVASYVTDDCNHDGIAKALVALGFIK